MDRYPLMMYRAPGIEEIHGGRFATLIVRDEGEEAAAAADGWHLTSTEAQDAYDNAGALPTEAPTEAPTLPPTPEPTPAPTVAPTAPAPDPAPRKKRGG